MANCEAEKGKNRGRKGRSSLPFSAGHRPASSKESWLRLLGDILVIFNYTETRECLTSNSYVPLNKQAEHTWLDSQFWSWGIGPSLVHSPIWKLYMEEKREWDATCIIPRRRLLLEISRRWWWWCCYSCSLRENVCTYCCRDICPYCAIILKEISFDQSICW